jgi:hypothetical protein
MVKFQAYRCSFQVTGLLVIRREGYQAVINFEFIGDNGRRQ